jgi:hypothetical protein
MRIISLMFSPRVIKKVHSFTRIIVVVVVGGGSIESLNAQWPNSHEGIDDIVSHKRTSSFVLLDLLGEHLDQSLLDLASQHLARAILLADSLEFSIVLQEELQIQVRYIDFEVGTQSSVLFDCVTTT